jgi:hypothetical protein
MSRMEFLQAHAAALRSMLAETNSPIERINLTGHLESAEAEIATLSEATFEIRPDPRGELDEVVAHNVASFHLERMNEGHWWMRLDFPDGRSLDINLSTRQPGRTKIDGTAEEST